MSIIAAHDSFKTRLGQPEWRVWQLAMWRSKLVVLCLVTWTATSRVAHAQTVVNVTSDAELIAALGNPAVSTIQLLSNVSLKALTSNWTSYQPLLRTTNVTVQSACGTACRPGDVMTLDFEFLADLVVLGESVTLRLVSMLLTKFKKVPEVGLELFHGRPGAGIELVDIIDLKLACAPISLQAQVLQNAPPSTIAPTQRAITFLDWFCWRGKCYNATLHYDDYASQVPLHNDENTFSTYGPDQGYSIRITNSTRLCASYWPLECLSRMKAEDCHSYYIDLALQQLEPPRSSGLGLAAGIAVLVVIVAGAAGIGGGAVLFFIRWRNRRWQQRQQQQPSEHDVESAACGTHTNSSGMDTDGRMVNDSALTIHNQQRKGWQLLACHTSPNMQDPSSAGDDKIELGVLLGAGSSGRVYRARWRNRDVAVKVLQHDAHTAQVVTNETDLMMGFDHPCIVRAFHVISWRQQPGRPTSLDQRESQHSAMVTATQSLGSPPAGSLSSPPVGSLGSPQIGSGEVVVCIHEAGSAGSKKSSAVSLQQGTGGSSGSIGRAQLLLPHTTGGDNSPGLQLVPVFHDRDSGPSSADSGALSAHTSRGGNAVGALPTSSGGWLDEEDDCGELPGLAQTWLVQELCDSGTLSDAVRAGRLRAQDGKPDMASILTKLKNVASGMQYLHARNVLHRDLKASNVLLASDPFAPFGIVAKVSDFGLSATMRPGQTHHSTRTLGTVSHMAPELLRAGRQSPAADVYAFGVLMWEAVSGRSAFGGAHYGEVFQRVAINGERPALDPALQHAVGEEYMVLMQACWNADPAARPTFDHICEALDLLLEHHIAVSAHGCAAAQTVLVPTLSPSRHWGSRAFTAPPKEQEPAPVQGFF